MSVNHNFAPIKGTCNKMCPENEIKMRERERLLHELEMVYLNNSTRKLTVDKNKMVKAFCRSAAGKDMQSAELLRTPQALLRTVNYLLNEVVMVQHIRWNIVYDFIVDRLKAVRQDMTIQQLSRVHCISILQPTIWFYCYSAYRLCEEPIHIFDPILNKKELLESLKSLLTMYDEVDQFNNNFFALSSIESPQKVYYSDSSAIFEECRPQFEALYILLNLGDTTAMRRALEIPKKWKTDTVMRALKVSMENWKGNFVYVCKNITRFHPLVSAILVLHLPQIRRKAFISMSVAYNSKQLCFPVEDLKRLFFYNDIFEVISDCLHFSLPLDDNRTSVQFIKTSFDHSKELIKPTKSSVIDKEINNCDLSALLLDISI